MTAINRRQAYETVDRFEEALAEYTGAPHVVCTSSCTDAIFLCFAYIRVQRPGVVPSVQIPKHTYVGVVQAVKRAGMPYVFDDLEWVGSHALLPYAVVDSAKYFARDMYDAELDTSNICVSFGASKRLPIGRGGAILTADKDFVDWIRPRIMDGRTPGEDYMNPSFVSPGWRLNMTPEQAARGLDLLTYIDDEPSDTWESYPDLSKAEWL